MGLLLRNNILKSFLHRYSLVSASPAHLSYSSILIAGVAGHILPVALSIGGGSTYFRYISQADTEKADLNLRSNILS